jgi:chromosome segregation ATPase
MVSPVKPNALERGRHRLRDELNRLSRTFARVNEILSQLQAQMASANAEVASTRAALEDADAFWRTVSGVLEVADAALRREFGPTVIGADGKADIDEFLRDAHDLLGRPGDYLTVWQQEWESSQTTRKLFPDLPERIVRRRAQLLARHE